MRFGALFVWCLLATSVWAADGNRLAYLDECDPYYPHRDFPRLTTPQWYGEPGVEAVVILAIDDMRDTAKYEAYLRPILERLKKIDDRAAMSIMANQVDPADPQLQAWLKEGVSIECHTLDHPCPLLSGGDFAQAKATYDGCVDLMSKIPGNKPVAFRMPCCDSLNTVSPRFFAEIFAKKTPAGNQLKIDSSVFNILTPNDPDLPRELVYEPGTTRERFRKYLPFPSFVNTIEDYPYPYLIGNQCWEFPCVVPSDWEAQNIQQPNNPKTVEDLKAALDCVVIKEGVFNLVFHPHGWIRAEQVVELIDYSVAKHGKRVKFISFAEAAERIKSFDGKWPPTTPEAAALNDPMLDRLVPRRDMWRDYRFYDLDGIGRALFVTAGNGFVSILKLNSSNEWEPLPFKPPRGTAVIDAEGRDAGLRFADVDGDGWSDALFSNESHFSLHLFESPEKGWSREILSGKPGDERTIPPIVRHGTNNGAWFHSRTLWVQNEDTARMPDLVDRRTFNELLGGAELGPRSAEASLKGIQVRPGLKVELVAAEPLVMDPVAFDWGPDGKLWVVEMGDYPLGADNHGAPGGRVRYLEDTDGDGKYDRSTLFLDGLRYPNGVMAWGRGVLVSAAPEVFYAEDSDGDGRADKHEALITGFHEANPQHRVNGFTWGLDNWVHCAMGESGGPLRSVKLGKEFRFGNRDFRFRPATGELDPQTGVTQFQRVQDDWGNWFGSDNIHPLWHYILADEYLRRNPHVAAPQVLREVPENPGAAPVFPTSRTLARFNDFHLSNHITSACGVAIYRDDVLGANLYGNSFVCEPVHNLIHREVISPDGVSFTSKRAPEEAKSEFLSSTDNWFRPVMMRTGPDGALYVADFYRQVLEHPEWIPDDIEAKIDLLAGHDRGRIYRIVPVDGKLRRVPNLDKQSPLDLVANLESPNGTVRDMTQRYLVERQRHGAIVPLRKLVTHGKLPTTRLQALCTLDGLAGLDEATVLAALKDEHAGVRRHALRLSEPFLKNDGPIRHEVMDDHWLSLTKEQDVVQLKDEPLTLQYACTVGALPPQQAAMKIVPMLLFASDHSPSRSAIASSITEANLPDCIDILVQRAWRGPSLKDDNLAQSMQLFAEMALAYDEKSSCGKLLEFALQGESTNHQLARTAGVLEAIRSHGLSVSNVYDDAPKLHALTESAAMALTSVDTSLDTRLAALEIIALDQSDASVEQLSSVLAPSAPAELREAAIDRLAAMESDGAFDAILGSWKSFTPQVRGLTLDTCFRRPKLLPRVLAALESGAILPSDFDADRRQRFAMSAGADLRERVVKALSAEIETDRRQVVEAFRDVLALQPDAEHGREVFRAKCAVCHKLGDVGHAVGADLAALTDKSPQALLIAILDPNRAVETKFVSYAAVTTDGLTHTGMLTEESGASITLLGQEDKRSIIPRAELEACESTGKSLMPEGLEKDLSRQDLADVMAFVANIPTPHKEFPGNTPETIVADEAGALKLTAVRAKIFGPTLIFEALNQNLGFWGSEADRATWGVKVERPGRYQVWLHYACHDDTAGNPFVVRAGEQILRSKVIGTGTWDYYRREPLGELDLSAGEHRVTFQSEGPIAGHLMDLFELSLEPIESKGQ